MVLLPWILALLAPPAAAQAREDLPELSPAALRAEYHRLSEELHNYAKRQAWSAVEQAYRGCVATGAPMKATDHFHAAHAARARGEMQAVRERLLAALAFGADRDVIDWLWSIDQTFSPVTITAEPGTTLVAAERPFDPILGRSIDFASTELSSTGRFEGLLPRGRYTAGEAQFELRMGKGKHELDLREPSRKPRKKRDRGRG